MSLFPIFKVNKLTDKEQIDVIYVFCGDYFREEVDDPNDLFESDPFNKIFSQIFDKNEVDTINKNKIDVIFLKESIHIDDNIGIIKLKIVEALDKIASLNELYLFCLVKEKLNPITVYQSLTQNDKISLTRIRFEQITNNLYDENGTLINFSIQDKSKYAFDDILKLDLTNRDYYIGKSLGQKFVFETEYPIIANPFNITDFIRTLSKTNRRNKTITKKIFLNINLFLIFNCLI